MEISQEVGEILAREDEDFHEGMQSGHQPHDHSCPFCYLPLRYCCSSVDSGVPKIDIVVLSWDIEVMLPLFSRLRTIAKHHANLF